MLNCRLSYGVGSGLAARIAGDAIAADADLPNMAMEDFLSCLSRPALETEASRHRVLPRGRVRDTRAALIEHVRETGLVLPAAHFALSDEESAAFAKRVSYYAYDDEADGDEDGDKTVDPSSNLEDADYPTFSTGGASGWKGPWNQGWAVEGLHYMAGFGC